MKEKTIKMIIYYILGVYDEEKKTIESCIEINKLLIALVKNEETKADRLLGSLPKTHPVSKIYFELRDRNDLLKLLKISKEKFENANIDNESLKDLKDDSEVEKLSKEIAK